ncbi:hypothetical protein [Vagococcus fluvialis]|uniref:Uncharacterized protein n=1 Tax=Vagococcus fluvialis TaxID=2738 RepID=A0A7X6I461_9ENTE|nr:hypothetical protein [Vagococcus fluvialis]NKC68965.1 hypothetical protein [Vagococcus fluvialis]
MTITNYQAYLDMREKLRKFEVNVSDEFKKGVVNRVYPHKCFDKSFDYIKQNGELPGVKYVEGVHTSLLLDHAWIEIDDCIVFEGTFQRFYDKESFYRERKLVKLVEFGASETWHYLFREQQGLGKPEFDKAKQELLNHRRDENVQG